MRSRAVARLGAWSLAEGLRAGRTPVSFRGAMCIRGRLDPVPVGAADTGDGGNSRARMRGLIASARIEDGNRP